MIRVSPPMILTATLCATNAGALWGGHPILVTLDIFAALYLLWYSVERSDDDDNTPPQHPLYGQ